MAESGDSRIPRRGESERDREVADQENGDQRVGERERERKMAVKRLVMGSKGWFWGRWDFGGKPRNAARSLGASRGGEWMSQRGKRG